ncbi:protein starmaker-like isoform X2 [Mytilus edulis]|uniref:protein starmaker-like isoform X2 n=1 Tax=Mytilus edulis TaxID=6550 RepID=UPI0039EFBC19
MAKANVKKIPSENGLQVLGENEDTYNFSNSASQKNPPVSSRSSSQASRRTPTPTKQISLTAVRRREESFHQEDDPSKVEELRKSMKLEAERSFVKESTDLNEFVVERNTTGSHVTNMKKTSRHNCYHNGDVETAVQNEKKKPIAEVPKKPVDKPTSSTTDKKKEVKKEESSSEESSDEEEEERKAPNQLLMEFLECIYAKDFPTAAKLCKMILIFEPDHPVALQFQPVIEEKIQQDIEAEQEGEGSDESGSDEEDSGEEDDSDSDDESDSDDSDDSDDDDEENDDGDNENEDNQKIPQPQQKPSVGPFKV